jgi:lysophospholipase L1-like esterase
MQIDRRALIAGAVLAGLAAAPAAAEQQSPACPPPNPDWANLNRYAAENAAMRGARVSNVFMGDSITQGWRAQRPAFFEGRAGRGIGGQTTPQMVLRMMADVVALKPKAVHIMAGTNDIAGNTGPMTGAMTQDNLRAMAAIARAHGIRVLLASIPPADGFPWRPGLETVPRIREINAWAKAHAADIDATWIDYTPALGTPSGALRPEFAPDGVHPNAAGYAAMEGVLSPVLAKLKL